MVIIGVDPHPDSHTAAALDERGKVLSHLTVENSASGLHELETWLSNYEVKHLGIEGANNPFARALSRGLHRQGYRLTDVTPSLTSQYRSRRGRKKSNEVDAENVARVMLANPGLSPFRPQQAVEDLKSLTRTREKLARELTAHRLSLRSLDVAVAKEAVAAVVVVLKEQLKELEQAMKALVDELMPELLEVQGVGVVHAATLLAEAGDVRRFRSQHAFAMYSGCAPVERSSGGQQRRQLNIGGNRRLNRTFHMIGQVRLRHSETTKAYLDKKQQQGKTRRAALRSLKTYLARELFGLMLDTIRQQPQRWASP